MHARPAPNGRHVYNRRMEQNDEISKSELKRRMHALQDLGARLVDLRDDALEALGVPEDVADAVRLARTLSREARRRQIQYIGKLLRRHPLPDLGERLAEMQAPANAANERLHRVEQWRDRLMADDDALDAFLIDYPGADSGQLRDLVAEARREQAAGRPPRSRRALFQLLRELVP